MDYSTPVTTSRVTSLQRRRRADWRFRVIFLAVWGLIMGAGLRWGLPSRASDALLFGGQPPWPAADYDVDAALSARQQRNAGADTDLNPLEARDRLVDLTATHGERAEILRRYRLYSRQPDEMITFQALQRMRPRALDLDPRLYQYGGAYIYGVGAALGVGKLLGVIDLTGDAGFFLDHPEAFGRFYVAARLISLLFGAAALCGVHRLGCMTGSRAAGRIAMALAATMPVFISGVLEAKPHIPSAALLVWSAVFAVSLLAKRRRRDAVKLGVAGGLAFGFVLTGVAAALHGLALLLATKRGDRVAAQRPGMLRHVALAALLGAAIYTATNPYVIYNALFNRAALGSNVSNSTAMYADQMRHVLDGATRTASLTLRGAGVVTVALGVAGFIALLRRRPGYTLAASAAGLGIVALSILLAAGKPTEFARFLVLPALLLAVAAARVVVRLTSSPLRAWTLVVIAAIASGAPAYVAAFAADISETGDTRRRAAEYLRDQLSADDSIAVVQEPAPYAVPPLDFAHRRVVLLPPVEPPAAEVAALPEWLVRTADVEADQPSAWWRRHYRCVERWGTLGLFTDRITWAAKPTFVYRRVLAGAE